MAKLEAIKRIREGLTPLVIISAFRDSGEEIIGEARFEISGFGFPVINQCSFIANKEGKILQIHPSVQIGLK